METSLKGMILPGRYESASPEAQGQIANLFGANAEQNFKLSGKV